MVATLLILVALPLVIGGGFGFVGMAREFGFGSVTVWIVGAELLLGLAVFAAALLIRRRVRRATGRYASTVSAGSSVSMIST